MSSPQTIHEQARFPWGARAVFVLLALAFAWLTVHTLGAWITGPSFFPRAAKPDADFGWPAPLASAAVSIFFLQLSSGRTALTYDAARERLAIESRWLIGGSSRRIPRAEIRAVRVSPLIGAWSVAIERASGTWESLLVTPVESTATRVAAQLADVVGCKVESAPKQ